jgi:Bacterial regulatory protein, Fis family
MIETAQKPGMEELEVTLHALGKVLGASGRVLAGLGSDFRILHGSPELDRLAGAGAAEAMVGRPVEDVLGSMLRLAGGAERRISLTVAPVLQPGGHSDPRVAYVAVLHPAGTEPLQEMPAPSPPVCLSGNGHGERDDLRAVLAAHCWRRDDTARALGISRTTLWRRMRELGL